MKNKSYDKKIFRLLFILNKLESKGKVKTSELADEFNVSIRSVQRDLELLNMTGFPLVMLDKGIHSFAEGFSLKKMSVSNEEASLLSFFYEMTKELGKNFEDSFRGILRKVITQEGESSFYAKMPEGIKFNQGLPFFKELNSAIEDSKTVEFYYFTQEKEKWFRVDPLKIIFFDGFWYLLSRVHGKDWILKFRLENIRKLKILNKCFEMPANLKTMLDESVNIWFSEKRDKKIKLKVDKGAARYFRQKIYFPLQKIKKENKDGSLLIESIACDYEEVIPIVLRWIPYVVIISPKAAVEQISDKLKKYKLKLKGKI
ncbi:MAG: transcriptional regulator [Candidatus Omnitrophica bacterium]|nr:transcriptional regulator [Candidatus Omnitrophota bacterium]MCF7892382.1 transcriptional regulator [Candidatus Omnitrophota bacterium]MCF7895951.1 transcriptional regulator [Candidatus Omnitrophota bacterium]MCF7898064.1 transcriptional regulator [Candidatus Omnitrophota bacterium]MCF7909916.1 transcriptional regulator [Candidatus Omnitrophota bacterium]